MFTNVQALRFWAASSVMLFHAAPYLKSETGHIPTEFIQSIAFAGVDVFFVISGFVIWLTARAKSGPRAAFVFLYNRVCRIYPFYWFFAFIALATHSMWYPSIADKVHFLPSLLLIPSPIRENMLPISWTLSFEIYFYIIFFLSILFYGQRLLIAFAIVVILTIPLFHYPTSVGGTWIIFLTIPLLLEFFAGCLIAANVERIRNLGHPKLIIIFGIAGLATLGWVNPTISSLTRVLLIIPCAVALVIGAVAQERRSPSGPTMIELGNASYAIYLMHTPVILLGSIFLRNFSLSPFGRELYFITVMIIIIFLSIAFYRWIERPLIHTLRERGHAYFGQPVRPLT